MNDQTQRKLVLEYVKTEYDVCAEYLWTKYPSFAVLRNSKSKKWFGIIMNISKKKLGFADDQNVDILNVKCNQVVAELLINNQNTFPAYHMNKEKWISIVLDKSTNLDETYKLIDESYNLTNK